MNRNKKAKIDGTLIYNDGTLMLRSALLTDAAPFVRYGWEKIGHLSLEKMNQLIRIQKAEIQKRQNDESKLSMTILENGQVIGVLETEETGEVSDEAWVEIYFPCSNDKNKKAKVVEAFIKLMKDTYFYEKIYVYRTEDTSKFDVDTYEIFN